MCKFRGYELSDMFVTEKRARSEGVGITDDNQDLSERLSRNNCTKHDKINNEENGTSQRHQSLGVPVSNQPESNHADTPSGIDHGLVGPAPAGGRLSSADELGGDSGRVAQGSGRRGELHGPAAAGTPGAGPLVDGEAPSLSSATR